MWILILTTQNSIHSIAFEDQEAAQRAGENWLRDINWAFSSTLVRQYTVVCNRS